MVPQWKTSSPMSLDSPPLQRNLDTNTDAVLAKEDDHREIEKIKAWSYSRNFTNDRVILTVFVGLRGYMYNPIR